VALQVAQVGDLVCQLDQLRLQSRGGASVVLAAGSAEPYVHVNDASAHLARGVRGVLDLQPLPLRLGQRLVV